MKSPESPTMRRKEMKMEAPNVVPEQHNKEDIEMKDIKAEEEDDKDIKREEDLEQRVFDDQDEKSEEGPPKPRTKQRRRGREVTGSASPSTVDSHYSFQTTNH